MFSLFSSSFSSNLLLSASSSSCLKLRLSTQLLDQTGDWLSNKHHTTTNNWAPMSVFVCAPASLATTLPCSCRRRWSESQKAVAVPCFGRCSFARCSVENPVSQSMSIWLLYCLLTASPPVPPALPARAVRLGPGPPLPVQSRPGFGQAHARANKHEGCSKWQLGHAMVHFSSRPAGVRRCKRMGVSPDGHSARFGSCAFVRGGEIKTPLPDYHQNNNTATIWAHSLD